MFAIVKVWSNSYGYLDLVKWITLILETSFERDVEIRGRIKKKAESENENSYNWEYRNLFFLFFGMATMPFVCKGYYFNYINYTSEFVI